MTFTDGVGYHDKNWGNQSVIDGPRYTDWGHGRLGPFSVVWYSLFDYAGNESRRSFVTRDDGEVLLVSCDPDALVVRQRGGGGRPSPAPRACRSTTRCLAEKCSPSV